nr:MAG TPA: hypothetical protein [Caudoviricetes sp.]
MINENKKQNCLTYVKRFRISFYNMVDECLKYYMQLIQLFAI